MNGNNHEESVDKSAEWSGGLTDRLETEEKTETAGGAAGVRGGQTDADGNGAGIGRKRCKSAIRERSGGRGQHLGCHLQGRGLGGSGRPPWGKTRGMGEGFRPMGKPGWRVIWGGNQ